MKKLLLLVLALLLTTTHAFAADKLDAKTYKTKKLALEKQIEKSAIGALNEMMMALKVVSVRVPEEVYNRFGQLPVRSDELRSYLEEAGIEDITEREQKSFLSDEDHLQYEQNTIAAYRIITKYSQIAEKSKGLMTSIGAYEKAKKYDRALYALQLKLNYAKQLKTMATELKIIAERSADFMVQLNAKYPVTTSSPQ